MLYYIIFLVLTVFESRFLILIACNNHFVLIIKIAFKIRPGYSVYCHYFLLSFASIYIQCAHMDIYRDNRLNRETIISPNYGYEYLKKINGDLFIIYLLNKFL